LQYLGFSAEFPVKNSELEAIKADFRTKLADFSGIYERPIHVDIAIVDLIKRKESLKNADIALIFEEYYHSSAIYGIIEALVANKVLWWDDDFNLQVTEHYQNRIYDGKK
jgi:hypothetical protein